MVLSRLLPCWLAALPALSILCLPLLAPREVGAAPVQSPPAALSAPEIGGCQVFPSDNVWNSPIDGLPLDPNSAAYIDTIGRDRSFHPDFGSGTWNGGPIGIPYAVVDGGQTPVRVTFDYADESDPGPYPVPANPPVEGGPISASDRHVLIVDGSSCVLYELFAAYPRPDGSWKAGSGAVFDLKSNGLRPAGWTSTDAAGLPILPGLVRYDEVASGEIKHAIRFTAPQTRRSYIWPARHYASRLTGSQYPPMGQRFRLRADYDISPFAPQVQVILKAMKKYGIILADNGSSWYISGAPDDRWNDELLRQIRSLKGADFEAVDASLLMVDANSAQARGGTAPTPAPQPASSPLPAQSYEFKLGFMLLATQIPDVVGVPLENEHHNPVNGDSLQQTSKGLMVWRKADNWTAFTNGSRTWVNGPFGVMERSNEARFDWEAR